MTVNTYGGEIEMLAVNPDGSLAPMELASLQGFSKDKNHLPINEVGGLTYDSCTHLLEANIFPTISLGELLERVRTVVSTTIDVAKNNGVRLLNASTYPLGTYQQAYVNNVRKIIYALFRGPATDNERVLIEALGEGYQHRNWKHECSSMFAGIQPWNSVKLADIESIFESLAIGSPLGKYATANGGYMEGRETIYTDNRWKMYDSNEGMLSTSIYHEDTHLLEKFPGQNFALSSYFHHIFFELSNVFYWK